ncbi:hypothetical protein [Dapis sp. BLCC M172]
MIEKLVYEALKVLVLGKKSRHDIVLAFRSPFVRQFSDFSVN